MGIVYPQESYQIMGACFEVYKQKGCGFLEPIYQECLELGLNHRLIPFKAQPLIGIYYKESLLISRYTPDFIRFDKIIIELKAVTDPAHSHRAQVHNSLRATNFKLESIVNGYLAEHEYHVRGYGISVLPGRSKAAR